MHETVKDTVSSADYYAPARGTRYETARGTGWVTFAGIMVLIAGTLNVIWGIAALDDANFFSDSGRYILEDLNTMGWIVLILGGIQVVAAFSIWAAREFGRWVGIIGACLGSIGALLSIPGFPLWSVCVFFVDVLVVYALIVYGGRQSQAQ